MGIRGIDLTLFFAIYAVERNSRTSLPTNHPAIQEIVKKRLKARTKMGGVKANQTSSWPCDPITAQKQRHLHKALLLPEGEVVGGGVSMAMVGGSRGGKRRGGGGAGGASSIRWGSGLLPAGYDEDPGSGKFAKVPVAPAPAVPLVKDREMYITSQQRSLSSVHAPRSKPYDHNNRDADRGKMSSIDLILERRENLKDEMKAIDEAMDRRKHEMEPVMLTVPAGLGLGGVVRPSTSLGFSRTMFEQKDSTFGRGGGTTGVV